MRFRTPIRILLVSVLALVLFVAPPVFYYCYSYYQSLENEVVTRFSGKRWDIPSRIFSDSLLVYPGQNLKEVGLFQRMARLNYHRLRSNEKLTARGEYTFTLAPGKLEVFLHSFSYPYHEYSG